MIPNGRSDTGPESQEVGLEVTALVSQKRSAPDWNSYQIFSIDPGMENGSSKRRLTAILAADVVGYARLMAQDEIGTLEALKQHRKDVFNPMVDRFSGRVFKLMGDGTLVEFASVVDAVNCAIAIQQAAQAADAGTGPDLVLRIGVHLGDIILDGQDIYGDGVNIAARLEPLADPGGVCISSVVMESVRGRAAVDFHDGGEITVKNIDRPLKVWHWSAKEIPASEISGPGDQNTSETDANTRETEPAIAVLPFQNMSGDVEQEYFSDGISEDIITDLSKVPGLLVIARNSSFAFKGKSSDLREVGKALSVTSILEGSVRRAGNRVRISAKLISTVTGRHLWAERYDRDLTDIFAVQDDVTLQIVEALKLNLGKSEIPSVADSRTTNVESHDLFLRGRGLVFGANRNADMYRQSRSCFERAIELDPDYAAPYAGLAMVYILDFQNHWSDTPETSLDQAQKLIDQAISLDNADPFAHYVAALIAVWQKNYDRWIDEADQALALNPNFAPALNLRALLHIYTGAPLKALPSIAQAIRLDPSFKEQYLHFLGLAHFVARDYQRAVSIFLDRININPDTDLSRAFLASALGHLGQLQDARQVWQKLKSLNPSYSYIQHTERMPFKDPLEAENFINGLTKAGLVE